MFSISSPTFCIGSAANGIQLSHPCGGNNSPSFGAQEFEAQERWADVASVPDALSWQKWLGLIKIAVYPAHAWNIPWLFEPACAWMHQPQ